MNNSKREQIALASYNKTIKFFESKKQVKKMSNIIVKIINEKRGSVEQFEYLNEKYKIKLISEKESTK